MQSAHQGEQPKVVSEASALCIVAFVLLLVTAGILECWQLTALRDPEIWGHLGIGGWILAHRSLPESGVFSQAAGLPWRDFSWGLDLLVATMHGILGLRALPALLIVFRMGLAVVAFELAGGWRNFLWAAGLSTISQYILFGAVPLADFVSVLFLGVELILLIGWHESGRLRWRFAVPSMFLVWANLDSGFVYGIVLYVVFISVLIIESGNESRKQDWLEQPERKIPIAMAGWVGAASFVAGCL